MQHLADEYKSTLKIIRKKVRLLEIEKQKLEHIEDCRKLEEIKIKLNILKSMERDTREIEKEVRNYYEGGWWRSEKYTLNQRKSRKHYAPISNIFERDMLIQLCSDSEDEESTI